MTAAARPASERETVRWVRALEDRLGPLDRRLLLAEWQLTMGRPATGAARWQARRYRLLTAPGLLERLRRARASLPLGTLARKVELLERSAVEAQVEHGSEILRRRDELSRRISAFRPRWRGRKVGRQVVRAAMRTSPDRRERERAYYAEQPLYRKMETDLRELATLRNERARALGFRSFPEYRLRSEGSSVVRLRALMEAATRWVPVETRRAREEFEDREGVRGWYPWDVYYAESLRTGVPRSAFPGQTLLPTVLRGVRRWGFPASMLRFRVDYHDLPAGGISLAPDPPRDVRIVVHPGGGWERHMILFHEVGHAVSSRAVRQPSHLLRWHEHVPGFAAVSEGQGGFFEQIASSEAWLREQPGLSTETVRAIVADARRAALRLIGGRVLWIECELALYESGGDPAAVARHIGRKLFGYEDHPPLSAANSFTLELPMYSPSYFFATLLTPLLNGAVLGEVGGEIWPNRRVGPWLIEHWFRDGTSYDWNDRLRELTGRGLSAEPFVQETRPPAS
jgi:hypothetical protein